MPPPPPTPYRAVFLDRDGVLNRKREDYVKSVDELEVAPDAGRHLALLQQNGFMLVIVTNQSAVNRGIISTAMLGRINATLLRELEESSGCRIDAIYVCPHRPDESCGCRKPMPGLLLQAAKDLKLDISGCWIIGDSDTDLEAGARAGCRGGIKLNASTDLARAVAIILQEAS